MIAVSHEFHNETTVSPLRSKILSYDWIYCIYLANQFCSFRFLPVAVDTFWFDEFTSNKIYYLFS